MITDFARGVSFFFQGLTLIFKPGFKRYLIVPVIMNAILLIAILAAIALYLSSSIVSLTMGFPQWIILILGWLFWIVYAFLSLLLGTLVFTFLTNIIAAPFYGLLAEAIAKDSVKKYSYTDRNTPNRDTSISTNTAKETLSPLQVKLSSLPEANVKYLILIIPRTLAREARKFLYFLPWLLLCLVFAITPFTWVFLPFVWWGVLSWILAIQYIDYQPDNEHLPFKSTLPSLKKNAMQVFGFGNAIAVAMLIPGANILVPPAAVAGGTALWLAINGQNHGQKIMNKSIYPE